MTSSCASWVDRCETQASDGPGRRLAIFGQDDGHVVMSENG
jgi:hypothetical protein